MPLPPPLTGPTSIGIAAPASAPAEPETLQTGIARLRDLGFRVVPGRQALDTSGYLAGADEERAGEFNAFLTDPGIEAIFCARGGYGTLRILPRIDYEAARRTPKLVVGYSDITALQLALFARCALPGISGAMVSTDWSTPQPESERLLLELARGHTPAPLTGPHGEVLKSLRAGEVQGTLLGGNLTMIVRLIGTPYLPDLRGALLFVEDVGEPAYRIDGLLAHLKLSGIWDELGGLIVGEFTESSAESRTSEAIASVFRDYCANAPFPVATGLRYGHIPVKNAVPVGVQAHLRVSEHEATLSILEPVVAPAAL